MKTFPVTATALDLKRKLFTPNHPDGGRYDLTLLFPDTPPVLRRIAWTPIGVLGPDDSIIVLEARRAACGAGCFCGAEVRALAPIAAEFLKTAPRFDE